MTPLVWRKNSAISLQLLCYATDILAFTIAQEANKVLQGGMSLPFIQDRPVFNHKTVTRETRFRILMKRWPDEYCKKGSKPEKQVSRLLPSLLGLNSASFLPPFSTLINTMYVIVDCKDISFSVGSHACQHSNPWIQLRRQWINVK